MGGRLVVRVGGGGKTCSRGVGVGEDLYSGWGEDL